MTKLPMRIYCDNKVVINIPHNPIHHYWTKHVEIDKHFIKGKIKDGVICTTYVTTTKQVVDILTKGLVKPLFEKLADKLRMFNLFSLA